MADHEELVQKIEDAEGRELTELEKEFLKIAQQHTEHIIALEKKVADLEALVQGALPGLITLNPH